MNFERITNDQLLLAIEGAMLLLAKELDIVSFIPQGLDLSRIPKEQWNLFCLYAFGIPGYSKFNGWVNRTEVIMSVETLESLVQLSDVQLTNRLIEDDTNIHLKLIILLARVLDNLYKYGAKKNRIYEDFIVQFEMLEVEVPDDFNRNFSDLENILVRFSNLFYAIYICEPDGRLAGVIEVFDYYRHKEFLIEN